MFSFFKKSTQIDRGKKKPEIRKISAAERISQHFLTPSSITPSGVAEKAFQGLSKIKGSDTLDMSILEEMTKKLAERESQKEPEKVRIKKAEDAAKEVIVKAEDTAKKVIVKAEDTAKAVIVTAVDVAKAVIVTEEDAAKEVIVKAEDVAKAVVVADAQAERISYKMIPSGIAEKASQTLSEINENDSKYMIKLEELTRELAERDVHIQRDKKLWEATFNSIPDLIVIVDKDRRIIRTNYSFCKRTGLTEQQYQSMKCHELLVGSTHPCSFCPATYKSGSDSTCYKIHEDITLRTEKVVINNQYLKGTFLFSSTEILDDDEQTNSVLVLRDISEFKEGV